MKLDQTTNHPSGPFLILHNCRKPENRSDSPLPIRRNLKRKKLTRFSIICTRRMAARLQEERLHQLQEEQLETQELELPEESMENEGEDDFFEKRQLEQGIPLQDVQDEDVLYNLNEVSRASNYSKLEKTLFGVTMRAYEDQQQEQNVIIHNEDQ